MNSNYIVYKITNKVNSKIYIGITKCKLNERWINHKSAARTGKPYIIAKAIRKYGEDNFICEEICHAFSKEDAEHLEVHFIKEYNSLKFGYNIVDGGNAFGGLSGKLNGMYGKKHTPETRKKMSQNNNSVLRGKSYEEAYGKKKANELKRLRSESMKEHRKSNPVDGVNNPRARAVHIKGLEFPTGREAALHFGIKPSTLIHWLKKYDDCWYL